MVFTAQQIAAYVGGVVEGDPNASVDSFAKIEEGKKGALSFLADPKFIPHIYTTESSVVIVNESFQLDKQVKTTLVRVENAYAAIAKLLTLYESMKPKKTGVSEDARVAATARIGEGCYIAPFVVVGENARVGDGCQLYPGCYVGDGVEIGQGSTLYPNVTVYHGCKLGERVILHAGTVIGADGFGFAPTPDGYEKIPQIGIVVIEDDVEIGANSCVDRSTMGATVVHKGVKIDNLVQVAHNVTIGEHTVMSAQVGVAGSSKVGKWCMLGGQVGVAGHLTVGDKTYAGAQSGIAGGRLVAQGGATVMGYPAIDHSNFARSSAVFKQLPELSKQVFMMQQQIDELKRKLDER